MKNANVCIAAALIAASVSASEVLAYNTTTSSQGAKNTCYAMCASAYDQCVANNGPNSAPNCYKDEVDCQSYCGLK